MTSSAAQPTALIEIERLTKQYPVADGLVFRRRVGLVKAVDGVSLSIHQGETLGLVGESGCGKSTLARLILRLIEPTSGAVSYRGRNVIGLSRADMHEIRQEVQFVFQDPNASLNPRMRVEDIIAEPLDVYGVARGAARLKRVHELMARTGLSPEQGGRFPHEFSGGQRQRIGIARALALNPKVLICDEPVSALDVSVQAQVINLLQDLQKEFGLTYLFIAHDLAVVKHISDRVAVMYLGRVVEVAEKRALYKRPLHPYTISLLASIPIPDPARRRPHQVLEGGIPSPLDPPSGCSFHPRCPLAHEGTRLSRCKAQAPELREIEPGRWTACHFAENLKDAAPGDASPGIDGPGL